MYSTHQKDPPTNGKVILNTTIGPIDVELWAKEAPKAAKNFVQLCLDGFYDGCNFFRVIPGFVAQTGDPTNTGSGPHRTYLPEDALFGNEIHSRLHFSRRGIVATAGTLNDPALNANQFFITLDKAPELEKKHTIFGKVVGDSIFNLIAINEMTLEKGFEDRLSDPPIILTTSVVWNPFDDIFPRFDPSKINKDNAEAPKPKPQSAAKAIKSFSHLSFGDEAEEDEQAFSSIRDKVTFAPTRVKSKLVHDEEDKPAISTKTTKTSFTPADEDDDWQRQMDQRAKEWKKAGQRADRRDERREQRILQKKRTLAGKTESDSDGPDVDEDGNPTYRKRKEGEVEDIDAPKFKKRKTDEEESELLHEFEKRAPPAKSESSQASSSVSKSAPKPRATSSVSEAGIMAKLAAFKSKLSSSASYSKLSEEDDWKRGELVFDSELEKDGEGKRDMQRDDYVVYDPRDEKHSSNARGSRYERDDRDRRQVDSRRGYSPERSREGRGRSPPHQRHSSSQSNRYDHSPPRGSRYGADSSRRDYRDASPRRSERHDSDERRESRAKPFRH